MSELSSLEQEILQARNRVYRAAPATPLERLDLPEFGEIWVKREDQSPIKSYKWRGSFNRMAVLAETAASSPPTVYAASAGNHAQGVARAARQLGLRARIVMPESTPAVKREAVRAHGGEAVEILLVGDSYDEALTEAHRACEAEGGVYVHAFDDPQVIAGQATLADEAMLSGRGPFDRAYLQVGGGGMAAGVATWLKRVQPGIRIIGVEGEGQASMAAAVAAGHPVRLADLDIFCDGTAVRRVGEWTHRICREVVDEWITVSNEEVSDAIRVYWEKLRCLQEPSGAMGLAGLRGHAPGHPFDRALLVACGANVDFGQLALISENAGIGGRRRRHLRIRLPERPGAMRELFAQGFAAHSVIDFQYGKVTENEAWPVFGFVLTAKEKGDLVARLEEAGYQVEEVDESAAVRFRSIPCRSELLRAPRFYEVDFFERPGALRAFLEDVIRGEANICYFNYRYSGERIGRALVGIERAGPGQSAPPVAIPATGAGYRNAVPLGEEEARRAVLG